MLLAALLALPATAYHLSNTVTDDWTIATGGLIVCESDGPTDPRNPAPAAQGGSGGLCTTGENAVTVGAANVPTSASAAAGYVRIDAVDGVSGTTDRHAWSAEIGIYACDIPRARSAPTFAVSNFALYYDRLYAWWSYDGAPPYANAGEEAGYHGHVSMFIDTAQSQQDPNDSSSPPTGATSGTVEVTISPTLPTSLTDVPSTVAGASGAPVDPANNCGDSPACPTLAKFTTPHACTSGYGVVFRAAY